MRLNMKRTRDHLDSEAQHRASVTLTGLSPSMTLAPTCAQRARIMTRPGGTHPGWLCGPYQLMGWKGWSARRSTSSVHNTEA